MEKVRFSRRTVLAAVPVVGGAAFLAACGTAQVAAPMEEKAAPEEKTEAAPAPAEEVQLTYLSRDSDSATLKVRALFDKYEAANPNITIAIQNMSSGDEAKTKLLVQAASGVPIDFLRTSWGSFAEPYRRRNPVALGRLLQGRRLGAVRTLSAKQPDALDRRWAPVRVAGVR